MGTIINSGLTSITGNVNSVTIEPGMADGQTRFCRTFMHSFAVAGSLTYFTPTAGKKMYITSAIITCGATVAYRFGDNITDAFAADTEYQDSVAGYMVANDLQLIVFPTPLLIATALKVRANGASGQLTLTISGYEVAA